MLNESCLILWIVEKNKTSDWEQMQNWVSYTRPVFYHSNKAKLNSKKKNHKVLRKNSDVFFLECTKSWALILSFQNTLNQTSQPFNQPRKTRWLRTSHQKDMSAILTVVNLSNPSRFLICQKHNGKGLNRAGTAPLQPGLHSFVFKVQIPTREREGRQAAGITRNIKVIRE